MKCASCGGAFSAAGLARHAGKCQPERDAEIVRRYKADESHRQIARVLGITPTLVLRVLKRQGVELRPAGRDRRERKLRVVEEELGPHPYFDGRCRHHDLIENCPPCLAVVIERVA